METFKPDIFHFLQFSQPTSEQREVLSALQQFVELTDLHDFMIITGAAGTGKTSLTTALIGYLNHLGIPYHIAAPTGRAARLIGRKARTVSSTIHSMIYDTEVNDTTGKVHWIRKDMQLASYSIFLIDEASMISKETKNNDSLFEVDRGLLYDLVDFIKKGNVNNKIIFLGDRYQLPPVFEEKSYALDQNFIENTFNLRGKTFLLTEVKRQKDGSYVLNNATSMRESIDKGHSTHAIEGHKYDNLYSASHFYVKDTQKNGYENQITIGVSHKANDFFNDLVRTKIYGKSKQILEKGDLLMVCQNWRRSETTLYNGDHVEILEIDWKLFEQVGGLHFVAVKLKVLMSEAEVIV